MIKNQKKQMNKSISQITPKVNKMMKLIMNNKKIVIIVMIVNIVKVVSKVVVKKAIRRVIKRVIKRVI